MESMSDRRRDFVLLTKGSEKAVINRMSRCVQYLMFVCVCVCMYLVCSYFEGGSCVECGMCAFMSRE